MMLIGSLEKILDNDYKVACEKARVTQTTKISKMTQEFIDSK